MTLKECMLIKNDCYKLSPMMDNGKPTGIVVHSTGANNKYIKRYVQPVKEQSYYKEVLDDLGVNSRGNHWNNDYATMKRYACVNAFIGLNAAGKIETYQTLPFNQCPWGCGKGDQVPPNTKYYTDTALTKKAGLTTDFVEVIKSYDRYGTVKIGGITYYIKLDDRATYNRNPWAHVQFEICEDDLTSESYFNKAMKEAQEFCAYLCKLYGLTANDICSHREAHARGFGSNHGDPDHWLKKFGKNMDWFRQCVDDILNPKVNIKENDIVTVSKDAVYYSSGKKVPSLVYSRQWVVKKVSKDKITIDKSVDGKYSISSVVAAKYLTVVGEYKESELQVGDLITINEGALVYGKKKKFSSWVYKKKMYVRAIAEDKVTFGPKMTGSTTGSTYIDCVKKVK